ncbi:helicase-related protein [Massilia sp. Root335]|uniref:helicase-related protein n=1 Tax=Massilia sp. Root335 TaxID=1736517 RepID=UPI0006FC7B13|nr:helicase-related protein [Massilia sp. Root335]KQV46396.1 hypothetical protein ASC93_14810 [Massilia sp. Root335]
MKERSELIGWVRSEVVGPSTPLSTPRIVEFNQQKEFHDPEPNRRGPLAWRPVPEAVPEEVLYYDRENPYRRYGAGLLHPAGSFQRDARSQGTAAALATDTLGTDGDGLDEEGPPSDLQGNEAPEDATFDATATPDAASDDFEVTSPDVRFPSTLGVTFCARLEGGGQIVIRLPRERRFVWQADDAAPFALNGRYEKAARCWSDDKGPRTAPVWRRLPALPADTRILIPRQELVNGKKVSRDLPAVPGSPLALRIEAFPRKVRHTADRWLITVVLRNVTPASHAGSKEAVLYQSYFDVSVTGGALERYPESERPFEKLDEEEQSLALLYRESATWAIGHGCAAGWDAAPGAAPAEIYADVMPAVELPSMTADVVDRKGNPIEMPMKMLAALQDDGKGQAWTALTTLAAEYEAWIAERSAEATGLPENLQDVALRNLDACRRCLDRMQAGIALLKAEPSARRAFRLANLAMLLQQIGTKQLDRRPLGWNAGARMVVPAAGTANPWSVYSSDGVRPGLGTWRAFQIAFLLMSLSGASDAESSDREIVDLIWFPTGGGKTEAYLGVMAYYMFHERLQMGEQPGLRRDGTNVLMRYTLRMLTTQQFQRAAALICAMEYLRRHPDRHDNGKLAGERFSLGLWIGADGAPNKIKDAQQKMKAFAGGEGKGNPLVLTECPWCRCGIGRYDGDQPPGMRQKDWHARRVRGITDIRDEGPLLHCSDGQCAFGGEHPDTWLPVEVIDERIYRRPPSLVIATADKFAMIAYRPQAGALFGRQHGEGDPVQVRMPPGLIIQDELHLISGPLGTMCALYEGIFEALCTVEYEGVRVSPKLIASTATIRGADGQVKTLYDRDQTSLFPAPGLTMGDSFFGQYARDENRKLRPGRLYLGIHASDYGSILTAQVRTFSSVLFRPFFFAAERRDPWWTLLAFYNSIRELSGARTLFDSDIRSRLKFMFNREGVDPQARRNLRVVEELTSRLSQSEIVGMMDRLSVACTPEGSDVMDACLASNIIEVGVDIDRLSLMGVIGQPKTTAQYIQVTGRVGRRWWERPGLILTLYSPSKSRDRSHFEQFHSYHRRLYERVEPTSATPFAISAIQRGLAGAMLTWVRQRKKADVHDFAAHEAALEEALEILSDRSYAVQQSESDAERSAKELVRVYESLRDKWKSNPQEWENFPPKKDGEYLMLWPGQFATDLQKRRGEVIPSSMRQVDGSAELNITPAYSTRPDAGG